MAYEQRSYAGNATDTALAGSISAGVLTFTVTTGDGSNYPDGAGGPFYVIVDYDSATAEKIRVTSRSGDTFTVPASNGRGVDGTTATTHAAGAKVRHCWTATDAQEANRAAFNTVGQVTTKGDLLAGTGANALGRVGVGADNTLLVGDSLAAAGVSYKALTALLTLLATTKGDLLVNNGTSVIRLGVGADGTILLADSAQTAGVRWGASPVSSGPKWVGPLNPADVSFVSGGASANVAVYYRFRCQESKTVSAIQVQVGATSGGNIDVGFYADSSGVPGSRLGSSGSVATPAANGLRSVSLTGSVGLTAGTDYWLAFVSSGTAQFGGLSSADANVWASFAKQQASALPLPATATPVAFAGGNVFMVGYFN